MFESLLGIVAIVALLVIASRQQKRLNLLERELGALRSLVLSGAVPAPKAEQAQAAAEAASPEALASGGADKLPAPAIAARAELPDGAPEAAASEAPEATQAEPASRPDIETALGTRWAVWVGGLALAFGAVFLIRYSIESGFFGPGARLTMAATLGLVLVGGGEFIRRTGYRVPVEGGGSAYIPAILTAAGAFALFGTVYAAHGLYGFIGAGPAFVALGIIGVAHDRRGPGARTGAGRSRPARRDGHAGADLVDRTQHLGAVRLSRHRAGGDGGGGADPPLVAADGRRPSSAPACGRCSISPTRRWPTSRSSCSSARRPCWCSHCSGSDAATIRTMRHSTGHPSCPPSSSR